MQQHLEEKNNTKTQFWLDAVSHHSALSATDHHTQKEDKSALRAES